MKNFRFTLLFAFLVLQSCDKESEAIPTCLNCAFNCLDQNESDIWTNDCIDNWECSFKINSQISEGKVRFYMKLYTPGIIGAVDTEFARNIFFELDESRNSFSVKNDQLKNLNVRTNISCFCPDTEMKFLNSGCMQGEKQSDGVWHIQGNLIMPIVTLKPELKFDAKFEI